MQEALASAPLLKETDPGQQLVSALAGLFLQMQPPAPPRRGKRLDPRWGEFGLLAALYFAPFNHGTAFPTTLLEAWARIDPAIAQVGVEHVAERPGDIRDSLADISKAREILGFAPQYDLRSGLDRAVPWYVQNWG